MLYQPEPVDNSIKCLPIDLKGHNIAAGLDADGRICLFAVKGDRLYHIREKAFYSGQFSAVEELSVTRPNTDSRIVGLTLHQLENDSNYPFILAVVLSSEGKYWLSLRYCNLSESKLFPIPITTECFTLSGNKRTELKLHAVRDNYGIYDVETCKAKSSTPVSWSEGFAGAETVKYISGNIFVLYKDSNAMKISALTDSADGTKKELSEFFTAENIHCFNAWGDEKSVSVGYYSMMETRARQLSYGWDKLPVWKGCPAGVNSMGVLSTGELVGCISLRDDFFKERSVHELWHDGMTIFDYWNSPGAFGWRRKLSPEKLSGKCGDCQYAVCCLGGCSNVRTCLHKMCVRILSIIWTKTRKATAGIRAYFKGA